MNAKFLCVWMITVTVVTLLSAVSGWAATDTIQLYGPNASTTNVGTVLLRAEVNGTNFTCNVAGCVAALANITTVQWEYSADAGGTWNFAASNASNINNGSLSNWTASYLTTGLSDALTYSWRARAANSSINRSTSASVTAVLFDNFNPATPSITSPAAGSISAPGFTVSANCVNASSATLTLGAQTYAMTMGGSTGSETCSYAFASTAPAKRIYNDVSILATDLNSDNTASTAISLTVDERGGNGGSAIAASLTGQGQTVQVSSKGELSIAGGGGGSGFGGLWGGSSMDWLGAALLIVGILTFVFPPLMAFLPPPFNLAAAVLGIVLVVIF